MPLRFARAGAFHLEELPASRRRQGWCQVCCARRSTITWVVCDVCRREVQPWLLPGARLSAGWISRRTAAKAHAGQRMLHQHISGRGANCRCTSGCACHRGRDQWQSLTRGAGRHRASERAVLERKDVPVADSMWLYQPVNSGTLDLCTVTSGGGAVELLRREHAGSIHSANASAAESVYDFCPRAPLLGSSIALFLLARAGSSAAASALHVPTALVFAPPQQSCETSPDLIRAGCCGNASFRWARAAL